MQLLIFALFLSLGVFFPVLAIKDTYDDSSSGTFAKYLVRGFGMAVGGIIDIDYNVRAEKEGKDYESYMLLLIVNNPQRTAYYEDLDSSDSTIDNNIDTLCTQPSMLRRVIYGKGKISFNIDQSIGHERFSVLLLQCRKGYSNNPIDAKITTEMKNTRPSSDDGYSHLPIEEVMFTRILEGEAIIYALLIVGLCGQIVVGIKYVRPIHWMFLVTLVAIFIEVILRYYDFYRYNKDGEGSQSVQYAVDILQALSDTLVISTLLVLSLGWSLVRSVNNISDREARLVASSLAIFFTLSLASAGCSGYNSSSCEGLSLTVFIVRSLLLLAIIIAMNFTVTQLRSLLLHSPWVPSTPIQYARTKQYQLFRMLFILYLLMPTAFLIVRVLTFSWKEYWVSFLMTEVLDILMVFHVGTTFSPLHENLLIQAFNGTFPGAEPAVGGGTAAAADEPNAANALVRPV